MVRSYDHHHSPPLSPTPKKTPKTHCRWNHEHTPENTCIRRGGKQVCRQCERDQAALCSGARQSTWAPGIDVEVSALAVGRAEIRMACRQIMRRV
jgi:hypothetical protein